MCCHALSHLAGHFGNWLPDSLLVQSNVQLNHAEMYVRTAHAVFCEMYCTNDQLFMVLLNPQPLSWFCPRSNDMDLLIVCTSFAAQLHCSVVVNLDCAWKKE